MAKVLVVTSGKGGVGKTTSTAALGAALAQNGQEGRRRRFRRRPAQSRPRAWAPSGAWCSTSSTSCRAIAKLPQALIRDKRLENLCLLPASQTRDKDALTEEGVGRVIAELREQVRLDHLRQPGRHRARRHARHALCRRGHHRHQSGSLVGARFRPHHRPARFQDREGREGRADRQAPPDHPLRPGARRARRDARRSRTCWRSCRSRCSASSRKARTCCAPPMSARPSP